MAAVAAAVVEAEGRTAARSDVTVDAAHRPGAPL